MNVKRLGAWVAGAALVLTVTACAGSAGDTGTSDTRMDSVPPVRPKIVVLGDSLTAGLGLPPDQAFPAVLQARVNAGGYQLDVVNAGLSGDTSAGGLRRVDWALDGDVRVVILALGANDGLRGVPVEEMRRNLTAIVDRATKRGASVLLAGMEAPPNFGPQYTTAYRQVFRDVAREHRLTFVPFLLEGVAGVPRLNQADGIHPNAEGARLVADHLWGALKPMIDAVSTR